MESLSFEHVREAAQRLKGHVHRTPVLTCGILDALSGNHLFFKSEHLQKVGAFKFRGAYHAVSRLTPEHWASGLATQSSGNHAQALALAGRLHHAPVHIVMPSDAPEVKKQAVKAYGATVHWCDSAQTERERVLTEVCESTGAHYIPPYDHPDIIAGQGTATLELLDQVADLDALVAPVGGGGLLSGMALAAQGQPRQLPVYGAEPCGADDAARSKASGKRHPSVQPDSIADGLLTSLGDWTWPVVRDQVEAILTVEDRDILQAMRWIWQSMKQVVEPSGAVALAAVLSPAFRAKHQGERIGIILSGGNVALDFFSDQKQS